MTIDHEEGIARMLAAFRRRGGHLFEPTTADRIGVHKKGTYGSYFAKPSPSVQDTLAIDRELLVLATSFPDLQVRTIDLVKELVDDAGSNRLEPTVAIVVHRDPNGDAKLRGWGRETGMTIIPLFMKGDDLPVGPDLERVLLVSFYSRDPFDVSGPVSVDNQFFGRRDDAADLARQLQQGQVRSCLGIRKIGKTSLLHRVLGILQDHHECYTVVVDCSKDSVWMMDAAQLLGAIATAIPVALKSDDFDAEVTAGPKCDLASAYAALIAALRLTNATVVLVMDETDYVTPGSTTAPHWRGEFIPFWRNLRAAHQELARSRSRLSVVVGGVSSKWFATESIDGIENAALAFLPEEYLAPMHRPASVDMIRALGRSSGLIIEVSAAEIIADACGNLPFWIRKAGSYIHRQIAVESRPVIVGPQQAKVLTDAFVRTEGASISEVALSHLFRVYPELKPVAAACAKGDASGHSAFLRNTLQKYGVIATASAYPDLCGSMMTAGLELALSNERSVPAVDTARRDAEPLRFSSLDEWAEEIALVGAQRNVLEKRIRAITLNFLRYDVLASKQRGSLNDRLLRIIDEKRRTPLLHLTAEEIVDKLNWPDLLALVKKEWTLFELMFSDKLQCEAHWLTVNQRFDAHAKDADRADLANCRRSLAWLEAAVARAS